MTVHRTLIVPAAWVALADGLCTGMAGAAGDGMFTTELERVDAPGAVWGAIAAGQIEERFAALLDAPGRPADIVAQAAQAGITVPLGTVQGLLAAIDVSADPPFTALARLGLQLKQEPI